MTPHDPAGLLVIPRTYPINDGTLLRLLVSPTLDRAEPIVDRDPGDECQCEDCR